MAEIIGLVSSGAGIASLAIQIAESMKKLKEFYDSVRDAPQDLKYLLQYLDTLDQHIQEFAQFETSGQWIADSEGFRRSIALCQNGAQEVLSIVKQLEAAIASNRKWGSIKTVLKKNDLRKLDERLDKAISLLTLSCAMNGSKAVILEVRKAHTITHTHLIMASEPARIASQDIDLPKSVTQPDDALAHPVVDEGTEELVCGNHIYTKPPALRRKALRFRIPIVFARTVFDFYYCRSISGWDAKFRTRNVVSHKSPLFLLAAKADIDGVKTLLQAGLASPYDVDEFGLSPCETCLAGMQDSSFLHKKLEFMKFFLAQAGQVFLHKWTLSMISSFYDQDDDIVIEIYSRLIEHIDHTNASSLETWKWFGGSPVVIAKLISPLDPPLRTYPLESRLKMALDCSWAYIKGSSQTIGAFTARLGCDLTDNNVLEVAFADTSGLLEPLISFFGIALARGDGLARTQLVKVLRAGASRNFDWTGSMDEFLCGFLEVRNADVIRWKSLMEVSCDTSDSGICTTHMLVTERKMSEALHNWLSCLEEAGVNMKDYGQREMMAMRNNTAVGIETHVYESYSGACCKTFSTFKITSLDIAHRSESWNAYFFWRLDHKSVWECLAGNFWDLVERSAESCQVKAIPGSWDPEWNCTEHYIITRPSVSLRPSGVPNRGWRVKAAKATARAEAIQAGMSTTPRWLIRQHKKRLRHAAILRGRPKERECREWWCEEDREWHYGDSWKPDSYAKHEAKELDLYRYGGHIIHV